MTGLTFQCPVHFRRGPRGRKTMATGAEQPSPPPLSGRVPRVARLMALAIRFDGLLRQGAVRNHADLARLGHVSRARVTQIMNLLNLAPDIQEELLFLPLTQRGRDPIKEWQVRPIAGEPVWSRQRSMWSRLQQHSA